MRRRRASAGCPPSWAWRVRGTPHLWTSFRGHPSVPEPQGPRGVPVPKLSPSAPAPHGSRDLCLAALTKPAAWQSLVSSAGPQPPSWGLRGCPVPLSARSGVCRSPGHGAGSRGRLALSSACLSVPPVSWPPDPSGPVVPLVPPCTELLSSAASHPTGEASAVQSWGLPQPGWPLHWSLMPRSSTPPPGSGSCRGSCSAPQSSCFTLSHPRGSPTKHRGKLRQSQAS